MTDIYSKEKRSEIMSKIRSKNTATEVAVFRELQKRKIYFQKHYKKAPGCPDIALPRKKRAVFIDGDFWHGCNFNAYKDKLSPRWYEKISDNIKRDRRNRLLLKKAGWKYMRVWGHQINNDLNKEVEKIIEFLRLP